MKCDTQATDGIKEFAEMLDAMKAPDWLPISRNIHRWILPQAKTDRAVKVRFVFFGATGKLGRSGGCFLFLEFCSSVMCFWLILIGDQS